MIEHFYRPIDIAGPRILVMRFTKQTFVWFQLCLFLDRIKMSLVLIHVWSWWAFVSFLSPKWATFGQKFIKFYLIWISPNVERFWFRSSHNTITSRCRWLRKHFFGTLWSQILYLLFRNNGSAYPSHTYSSWCYRSAQNSRLHSQTFTRVFEFDKVTALLF